MSCKKKEVSEKPQLLDILIEARIFWRKESYHNHTTEHKDQNVRQSFGCNAKIVHIDIDPAEHDKNLKATVPVVGNLSEILPEICWAFRTPPKRRAKPKPNLSTFFI